MIADLVITFMVCITFFASLTSTAAIWGMVSLEHHKIDAKIKDKKYDEPTK